MRTAWQCAQLQTAALPATGSTHAASRFWCWHHNTARWPTPTVCHTHPEDSEATWQRQQTPPCTSRTRSPATATTAYRPPCPAPRRQQAHIHAPLARTCTTRLPGSAQQSAPHLAARTPPPSFNSNNNCRRPRRVAVHHTPHCEPLWANAAHSDTAPITRHSLRGQTCACVCSCIQQLPHVGAPRPARARARTLLMQASAIML
jgi:hypothetical protein